MGGNETLICGKHGILFCFYCQTVLYIIKNKVIDSTQLYDIKHSVVLLTYQPIMCTQHRNKAIDDVYCRISLENEKIYYKIQRVFCIHAIILLYFEKKIADEIFEIYKRSSKTKLMSQTEFAKALCVSYSIVSR